MKGTDYAVHAVADDGTAVGGESKEDDHCRSELVGVDDAKGGSINDVYVAATGACQNVGAACCKDGDAGRIFGVGFRFRWGFIVGGIEI